MALKSNKRRTTTKTKKNNKMTNNKNHEQQQNEEQNEEKKSLNNYNQHHKNLTGGSPKQSNFAGSFCPLIKKKMITEVLLILPLYLILFLTWWRFRHLTKIMADVGDTLNDDDLFW